MGPRSLLTLLKLGFDLRSYYEDLLAEPVPDNLRSLINQLRDDAGEEP